jgi:hypothetical protein
MKTFNTNNDIFPYKTLIIEKFAEGEERPEFEGRVIFYAGGGYFRPADDTSSPLVYLKKGFTYTTI